VGSVPQFSVFVQGFQLECAEVFRGYRPRLFDHFPGGKSASAGMNSLQQQTKFDDFLEEFTTAFQALFA
jgi:hypothetical protein